MNFLADTDKISIEIKQRHASLGEPNAGKRAGRLASANYWLGLGRRMAAWTTERLVHRRLERNKSRLALADIDENDLSEFGRRVRTEVLRERRDRELGKRGSKRPVLPPPVWDGLRALGYRIVNIYRTLTAWQLRARMRAELMALDDRTLKDIGLTRADVLMMLMKYNNDRSFLE